MKIGLLAYHSAINFGATLQLYSTYCFVKNRGHQPVVINWVAPDLADYYSANATQEQMLMQESMRRALWVETAACSTSQDVADVIKAEKIDAVVIGSDAVAQHHSVLERLAFPCRTIVGLRGTHSDCQFPNAFWADWQDFLPAKIPVAVISASCQDSAYRYMRFGLRKAMCRRVMDYYYLSVRDSWTQRMMSHITHGKLLPDVTPDPVFAFEQNASHVVPEKEVLLKRYNLPDDYILMSFINKTTVTQQWIDSFAAIAASHGKTCVMLPFAHAESFGQLAHTISLPLSPIDWYALIKYSSGYVGHNMHPIVVSLHNNVPFFSFDNYGTKRFNGLWPSDESSKIRHILQLADLMEQRVPCLSKKFKAPAPEFVYNRLIATDKQKLREFAGEYLALYNDMMRRAVHSITKQ